MGKKHSLSCMKTSATVEFHQENNDGGPGCMWGMLHILDYHHWLNIRNVFPLKKHHYPSRLATYKRINILHSHWGDQQIGDEETEPLLQARQHEQKCSAKGKSSSKSRNKRSQTENSKGWIISFHGESKNLGSSHKFVQSKAHDTKEGVLDQNLMEANKLNRDTPVNSKRHSDSLEVLGVEKDLILKYLHDLHVGGENLQLQLAFNNKASLKKSGSVQQTSQMRSIISPTTFEHKQSEIWPFDKKNKLVHSTQALKTFASIKQKQRFSSSSSNPQGLNHKGWNQLVLHRFKVIKQKIKHALMEFKKSSYQTSVEAIHHHRASSEYGITNTENGISDENKYFCFDSSRHKFCGCKRIESSLNESLDRYTQLFEQSFGKDIKCHGSMSKSLKLPNEDKDNSMSLCQCPPKDSRRKLSLPNLDSFNFLILHEELSVANDIHVQRKPVRLPLNKNISLDHITETEMEEAMHISGNDANAAPLSDKTRETNDGELEDDVSSDTHELALEDGSFLQEQLQVQISMAKEAIATLEASVVEAGRELNTRSSSMNELEIELPNNTNAIAESRGIKSDNEDIDSNFKYVKHVLEYLGLMGNEENIVQLINPPLLMDFDTSRFHEIESNGEDSVRSNHHHHHLLLSNIVKEVLLQIYETSSSTNFTIMHKGQQHLLNEVWIRVNLYLRLRPEFDQTLDDVVGGDLAKNNGWMILKHEEECAALELEENIFKDLVDEIIFT
ncbi:protein TRM32-like isoform X1 [Arachis stenosperma]|uniref:protein TRM32-like isoform X1 n=1 Tax=Arachis stenosperma TaxID=217475 RepID=UPI0025AC5E06|nr:protein TRM32-like isoform X1 [Arachis stenosperma]XP_057745942.1 protein TRM32-like isoform X1 [Arachis stenosperma]